MEGGVDQAPRRVPAQEPKPDSLAHIAYAYTIDAFKSYPKSTKVMGARILQLARRDHQDMALLADALIQDPLSMSNIAKAAHARHSTSTSVRAHRADLSPENVRKYVERAFRNAQALSVLSDPDLAEITQRVYHMFDGEEVDEEAMINHVINGMVANATKKEEKVA